MIRKIVLATLVSILLPCMAVWGQSDPNVDPNDTDAIAAWFLGDYEFMGLRLGYVDKTLEVGAETAWQFGVDNENDPVLFGGYGLYHLPESLNVENLPLFSTLGDHIQGVTYLGIHGGIQTIWNGETRDRWYFGPVAGAVINKFIFDSVNDELSVITEVQYNRFTHDDAASNRDEIRVMLGLRIWIP